MEQLYKKIFPQQLLLNGSNCDHNICTFLQNHEDDIVSQMGDKIKIRTNIIIMQRNDGSGNFDIDNPSHLTYLQNVFSYLNSKISNLTNESCNLVNPFYYSDYNNSCSVENSPTFYPKLNVEFVPNFIEIQDDYGWNHRNDHGYLYETDKPFLRYIFNLAKQKPGYLSGINVILTEDRDAWEYIDDGENPFGIVPDKYYGHAYSMHPNFNDLNDDYLVWHFPNLFSGKYLSELYYGWTEEQNKIKNANGMIHEYGHLLLGLYHTDDCENGIMNPSGTPNDAYKKVITGNQVRQWYLTMMTSNIRNVIECEDNVSLPTLNVDTDEIWTNNFKILGDIVVKSGKSLTIKCELNFMPNAKIFVEKGAKLIVDGGKLTSACGSKWEGIIVYGDPTKDHTNLAAHGIVETKNGAIIENAEFGIGNHKFSHFLNNSGGIVKCDNSNFINCDVGIRLAPYKFENEGYVNNCSFMNGEWGIYLKGVSGIEIKGSLFEALERGINAFDSKLDVKEANIFRIISDAGIASLATSPGAASMVVTNNHFVSCQNYGITLSGNTANATQDISENYFENCWFAIDVDGDNNYHARDNRFNSCSYGVLSWASNDFVNDVKCNEMLYTRYGSIYMLYRNSQSSFLGNNFLESAAGQYKFDFRAQNATIAMEQGDKSHPAMNYFWSTDDIETENSELFTYFKPNTSIPRTDPQNPGNYFEDNSISSDQWNCGTPPVPVVTDVQIRLLKDEYCRLLLLYRSNPGNLLYKQMFYQISRLFHLNYYYWSIQNEQSITWQKIDELLSLMCGYKWKIRRYGLNLYHGDIAKAESILNELADPRLYELPIVPDDLSDESRISFITTQRINLRYLKADSTFQFTNADIDALRTEAERNIPERAYARSLYTLATGDLLPRVLPEEGLQPRESDVIINETGWTLSPNPASNILTVTYKGKGEISGKILVYGTDGRLMLDIPTRFSERSNIELNVSLLESGIYMFLLTDNNNSVIFKDKFIKIK